MQVAIPVSIGELVDKITILEIKASRFEGEALSNVRRELRWLVQALEESGAVVPSTDLDALRVINSQLWSIEDDIRAQEAAGDFGERFIDLARSVYRCNDQRAAIKRRINPASGSTLIEEKGYAAYWPGGLRQRQRPTRLR